MVSLFAWVSLVSLVSLVAICLASLFGFCGEGLCDTGTCGVFVRPSPSPRQLDGKVTLAPRRNVGEMGLRKVPGTERFMRICSFAAKGFIFAAGLRQGQALDSWPLTGFPLQKLKGFTKFEVGAFCAKPWCSHVFGRSPRRAWRYRARLHSRMTRFKI